VVFFFGLWVFTNKTENFLLKDTDKYNRKLGYQIEKRYKLKDENESNQQQNKSKIDYNSISSPIMTKPVPYESLTDIDDNSGIPQPYLETIDTIGLTNHGTL